MITTFVCEYCGYSEPYGNNIGQEPGAVVRARIVRHEQRCDKNPLVKTIKDIRAKLESVAGRASFLDRIKAIQEAIRMTYDCFLDQEVQKEIEVKNDSGQ